MLAGLLSGGCATGEPSPQEPASRLAVVAWLAGSWTTADGTTRFEEVWLPPAGDSMVGVGREVVDDATRSFEYLRIEARSDGIYYLAAPGGGPVTAFRLVQADADHVRFENPAHDFPTAIAYRRSPDGTLTAHVKGGQDGAPAGFELRFHARR
jgi:hypothetical protein